MFAEPMNDNEFLELIARMRNRQKEYFRTRSSVALCESRALEREVDAEIDRRQQLRIW